MHGLKDLLRKKEKITADSQSTGPLPEQHSLAVPEFKIVRTTTEVEEEVQAPDYPDQYENEKPASPAKGKSTESKRHRLGFRRSSNARFTGDATAQQDEKSSLPTRPKGERRLSARLHLSSRGRSASYDSTHLPGDLPEAPDAVTGKKSKGAAADEDKTENEQREAQWEKRATLLAEKNPLLEQAQPAPSQDQARSRSKSRSPSITSTQRGDDDIQEAIRLHELGELSLSTAMFGRLGDAKGGNNALAQVLYGLALRHGWGVEVDSEKAIQYLSLAASNSAGIERAALESGLRGGGAAKGELVLAIFELGNCFRHG